VNLVNRLCIGTYAAALQEVVTAEYNNQPAVIRLLFNLALDNVEVLGQTGEPYDVTDKIASGLFRFTANVHKDIRRAAASVEVIEAAADYVEDVVLPFVLPDQRENLVARMSRIIAGDIEMAQATKNEFRALEAGPRLADFLSKALLYALVVRNKKLLGDEAGVPGIELATIQEDIAALKAKIARFPRPAAMLVPVNLEAGEQVYVEELFKVYGEAIGNADFTDEDLEGTRYKTDFERRRKDYFAAESLRRGLRDVFGQEETEQFETLKEEVHDGVIDVHAREYDNGYTRLNEVMRQAAGLPLERCWISRATDWIGACEKKGSVHHLVNDRRIGGWL
jgi:hypothetical protein